MKSSVRQSSSPRRGGYFSKIHPPPVRSSSRSSFSDAAAFISIVASPGSSAMNGAASTMRAFFSALKTSAHMYLSRSSRASRHCWTAFSVTSPSLPSSAFRLSHALSVHGSRNSASCPSAGKLSCFLLSIATGPASKLKYRPLFTTSPPERRPVSAWLQVRQRIRPPQAAPRMCRPR